MSAATTTATLVAAATTATVEGVVDPRRDVVVGEMYYRAKDRVLELEQEVLRSVGYRLDTPQPHKYLLNMCHVTNASPAVAQLASVTLLDACFETTLLLRRTAAELAAGALQVSAALIGVNLDRNVLRPGCAGGGGANIRWFHALGVDPDAVEATGGEMLDVLLAKTKKENAEAAAAAAAAAVGS